MGEVRITDEMLKSAIAAFDAASENPILVNCKRCDGKGYHHGFGETGCDPDWCSDCGGGGFVLAEGEEHRPLRAALSAALSGMAEPVAWRVKPKLGNKWSYHPQQPIADPRVWDIEDYLVEALYTAPQSSRLREALKHIAKTWPDSFAARHALTALNPEGK